MTVMELSFATYNLFVSGLSAIFTPVTEGNTAILLNVLALYTDILFLLKLLTNK